MVALVEVPRESESVRDQGGVVQPGLLRHVFLPTTGATCGAKGTARKLPADVVHVAHPGDHVRPLTKVLDVILRDLEIATDPGDEELLEQFRRQDFQEPVRNVPVKEYLAIGHRHRDPSPEEFAGDEFRHP